MKPLSPLTSTCRYCRAYRHEGRRGGYCGQLDVPVQSGWKACQIAIPAFAPSWEGIEETLAWEEFPVRSEPHLEVAVNAVVR